MDEYKMLDNLFTPAHLLILLFFLGIFLLFAQQHAASKGPVEM